MINALGALGRVVNAAALTGSVIYLALQVHQANRLARMSAIDSRRDATRPIIFAKYCGPETTSRCG